VAFPDRLHQPEPEILRFLEHRLNLLEQQQRFECAYALRMEVADWLFLGNAGAGQPATLNLPSPL
jgi:hypothetical protein